MDKYEKLEAQTQAWSREWWTTLMITGLWNFCHECWSFHNKEKHGHDKKEAEKKQSKTLVSMVKIRYTDRPALSPRYNFMYDLHLEA